MQMNAGRDKILDIMTREEIDNDKGSHILILMLFRSLDWEQRRVNTFGEDTTEKEEFQLPMSPSCDNSWKPMTQEIAGLQDMRKALFGVAPWFCFLCFC